GSTRVSGTGETSSVVGGPDMAPHTPHRSDAPRRSRGAPRTCQQPMAIARVPVPEAVEAAPPGAVARWLAATREFCRARTLGAVGAAVIVVMFAVALLAPVLAAYDPEAVDFGAMLARPSLAHWLGTDSFGRDVLSRLIFCSRTALIVGFGASVLGATLGAILAVGSAYFGGRADLYLHRVMNVFLSFPLLGLGLALVAILG